MEKCGVVSVCNWLVKSAVQICVAHVRECCTAMWDGGQFTWQFWNMTGKRTYSWLHFNRSSHLSHAWSAQLFTKVEANNCFSIYHTKTKKITIKLFLSTYQKNGWKLNCWQVILSLWLLRGEKYLLITS